MGFIVLLLFKLRNNTYPRFFIFWKDIHTCLMQVINFHFDFFYSLNCANFYVALFSFYQCKLLLHLLIIPVFLLYPWIWSRKPRIALNEENISFDYLMPHYNVRRQFLCNNQFFVCFFYKKSCINARCFTPGHLALICVHVCADQRNFSEGRVKRFGVYLKILFTSGRRGDSKVIVSNLITGILRSWAMCPYFSPPF